MSDVGGSALIFQLFFALSTVDGKIDGTRRSATDPGGVGGSRSSFIPLAVITSQKDVSDSAASIAWTEVKSSIAFDGFLSEAPGTKHKRR